jgi:hypothetical protein
MASMLAAKAEPHISLEAIPERLEADPAELFVAIIIVGFPLGFCIKKFFRNGRCPC